MEQKYNKWLRTQVLIKTNTESLNTERGDLRIKPTSGICRGERNSDVT